MSVKFTHILLSAVISVAAIPATYAQERKIIADIDDFVEVVVFNDRALFVDGNYCLTCSQISSKT